MKDVLRLSEQKRRLIAGAMAFILFAFHVSMAVVPVRAEDRDPEDAEYDEEMVLVNGNDPYVINIMKNPKVGEDPKWVPYVYHYYKPPEVKFGEEPSEEPLEESEIKPEETRFLTLGEGLLDEYWSENGLEGQPPQGKWELTRTTEYGPERDLDHGVLTISGNGEATVYQPGTVIITYTYETENVPVASSAEPEKISAGLKEILDKSEELFDEPEERFNDSEGSFDESEEFSDGPGTYQTAPIATPAEPDEISAGLEEIFNKSEEHFDEPEERYDDSENLFDESEEFSDGSKTYRTAPVATPAVPDELPDGSEPHFTETDTIPDESELLFNEPEMISNEPEELGKVPVATPGESLPPVQESLSWKVVVVESNDSLDLATNPPENEWKPSENELSQYKNEMPRDYPLVTPYKAGDYRYYHTSRYVSMKEPEIFNLLDPESGNVYHLYCSDLDCPDAAGAWYKMTPMSDFDKYLGNRTLADGDLEGKLVSVLRHSYPYIEYDDMIAAMKDAEIIGTGAGQILESTLDYNQIITAVQTVIWKLVNVPDMTLYQIETGLFDDPTGKTIDPKDPPLYYTTPQRPLFDVSTGSNAKPQFTPDEIDYSGLDTVYENGEWKLVGSPSAKAWNENVCRAVVIKNFDIIYHWLMEMPAADITENESLPVNPTVRADPVQFNAVNNNYDVSMSISLDVPVKTGDPGDKITVSIYKCDENGKSVDEPIRTEEMKKNILSLELTGFAAGQYRVKIGGTRYLPKDVYFYVSQNQSSQCFIGAAEKNVGISGEASFSIPFDEAYIQVLKTADDHKTPVEGAEFGLFWHSGEGNDIPIATDMTDPDGKITFKGLSKNLVEASGNEKYYYIQELSAPTGYVKSDEKIRVSREDIIPDESGQSDTPPLYRKSITNSYQTGSLTISKAVKDNAGNERNDLSFSFSVVLSRGNAPQGSWNTFVDSAGNSVSVDDEKKAVTYSDIVLGNGDSFAIEGIPAGVSYQVTETTAKVTIDGTEVEFDTAYKVTAEKADGTYDESQTGTGREGCSGEIGNDSLYVTAAFTNTIQTPEPDTSSSSGSTEETDPSEPETTGPSESSSESETTGPSESSPESETTRPSESPSEPETTAPVETVPRNNPPEEPAQNPNVEEIPEGEVPLAPQIPYEEIADMPVPLADVNSLTEIQDEDVPLAFLAPVTGDEKPIGVVALFGLIALGMMGVFGILASKKRDDET